MKTTELNKKDFLNLVYDEIKKAAPQADPVEMILGEGNQTETEIRNGEIESLEKSDSSSLSVTLAIDNRRVAFSTNDLSPGTIKRLLRQALETVTFMDQDPFYQLPETEFLGIASGDLKQDDPYYPSLEAGHLIEIAKNIEQVAKQSAPDFISNGAYVSVSSFNNFYLSSAGFLGERTGTIFRKGLSLVAEDGKTGGANKGRKQSSGYSTIATHWEDLDHNDFIAEETIKRLKLKLGAVKPGTTEVPVLFTPEVGRSLLGTLEAAISGHALYRNATFLLDKKGEQIGSNLLNIEDNPLLPKRLGSRLFDSEGVKAQARDILLKGVLQTYLLDTYSAKKLNTVTNGFKGGSSNLILKPGQQTQYDLVNAIPNGLYLTELSGQGINVITGDFSRGAQGVWIENGELSHPVSEFTINSNMKDMLKNISMIANDLDWRSSYVCPSFLISNMTIAGK